MRAWLLLVPLGLLHLDCRPETARQTAAREAETAPGGPPPAAPEVGSGGPEARVPATAKATNASTRCVDAQLAARGLNQFGDPPDTVYAGGTPLFDEKTSASQDRISRVLARQPAIALACAGRDGATP